MSMGSQESDTITEIGRSLNCYFFFFKSFSPLIYLFPGGFLLLLLCSMTCGMLVPPPPIELGLPAVKAQNPNPWAARESPVFRF